MSIIDTHNINEVNNSLLKGANIHYNLIINECSYKSKFSQSFITDQQNAKELQILEQKAVQLKQKQKKYRMMFLKLKKLFELKTKQYQQFQKISNKSLTEKNSSIQLLTVQIQSLKEQKKQYQNLKDQRDILLMKKQQLQVENNKLTKELETIKNQCSQALKVDLKQKSLLLNRSIKNNQINQNQPDGNLGSFSQVLNSMKKSRRKMSDLIKVQDQQRNQQIKNFSITIENLSKELQQKNNQINKYKSIIQEQDKVSLNQKKQTKQKQILLKNYQKLQNQLLKIFQTKAVKEYFSIYEAFSVTTKQIFKNLSSQNSQNSQKLYENIVKIVQCNIIKLNDYFKGKAKKDIKALHKMMGYVKNAGQIIQKTQQQYQNQKDTFNNTSSPQRINFIQPNSRQLSNNSSAQSSYRKSIVLEQDLQNALSDDFDKLKQQALQITMNQLKQSQLMNDRIDQSSHLSGNHDNKSDLSASQSRRSSMTQSEKQFEFKKNQKNAKINAKLKKSRKR